MDMKRSYYEDIQLLGSRAKVFWFIVLLAFLAIAPFVLKSYYVYVITLMGINILVALGLNILVGNTGQISLGHAGFVAIGAYTTLMLILEFSLPLALALVIGGFTAAFFGFLLGLPALRLEGPYLAIATLAFGIAVAIIIGRTAIFGGHMGLSAPRLTLFGNPVTTDTGMYFITMSLVVVMAIFARNIIKSRVGRAFHAIRDSEIAASSMGVNVAGYKTLSFAISAFYAGIAGGLMAFVIGFINPGQFNFVLSIIYLATVVVGGLGTILGSVLGAVFITFLNLQMENIQHLFLIGDVLMWISQNFLSVSGIPNVHWVFTGFILILIVVFEPLGLYGIWLRIKIYWMRWPF